ncbi:DUF2339 domain-containing protein [Gorillibacterium sp. sgz5001074]|uniref:DUF2339 domain-containing protein n=1 Tax=Gorillibacterium sp. sgz5001074 TaxID=3446695 RepID=UPI003F67B94B
MPVWFRKHWTSLLGSLFVICSIIYLFKFTIDQGWITNSMKTGAGLAAGAGAMLLGVKLILGKRLFIGEIVSGMGASILYTTFAFSGVYYALWDSMTVFLSMMVMTVGLTVLSYRHGLRILMNLALLGAFAAPLVMRPENDQVFTLFLYLLVLNAAYFTLSIRKRWAEFRLLAFAGTWLTYMVYYIHFDPATDSLWSMPFRYAVCAFVFYVVGFFISSWKTDRCFDGMNLYLGFVNAVLFGLWSSIVLDGILRMAYPLAAMGLLYAGLALVAYRVSGSSASTAITVQAVWGAILLLLSLSQLGDGLDMRPIISVYVWGILAALLMAAALRLKAEWLQAVSMAVWTGVTLYWFAVTWDAPRGEWFGVYMPFLNSAAVAWMLLAATGFWYSLKASFSAVKDGGQVFMSRFFSVVSHLIVGGLLMLQIDNMFEEYRLSGFWDRDLTLSVVWGVYALLLFLWGASSKQRLFRGFGSVVLGMVSIKVLFYDLSGEDTVYKVLVLLVMAAISFAISYINHRWQEEPAVEPVSPAAPAASVRGMEEGQTQQPHRSGHTSTIIE